ncbi:RdgB/HAM1 family non-canonical purine NTP pyrophosphatase [Chloroflexota bacterium]
MTQLLIATNNPGKQKEIFSLLNDVDVELVTPAKLGLNLIVNENGATYRENAAKKAIAFSKASGMVALADDSGLEVDALGGAPGLFSARYAPQPNATDADRRKYILKQLNNHPQPWLARFCCVVAIATLGGDLQFFEGNCSGIIIPHERGSQGFGYDQIFLIPSTGKTMAELLAEEKNCLSHRANAIKKTIPTLLKLLDNNET